MPDNYNFEWSTQEKEQVEEAIRTLKRVLLPKLNDLSIKEKRRLPKMGDKTYAFVEKSLLHMSQNASLVPSYVDLSEAQSDLSAVKDFRKLRPSLHQLREMVDESMMRSGSQAYRAALAFYQSVKMAAKEGVPGTEAIYDDLKIRFAKKQSGDE